MRKDDPYPTHMYHASAVLEPLYGGLDTTCTLIHLCTHTHAHTHARTDACMHAHTQVYAPTPIYLITTALPRFSYDKSNPVCLVLSGQNVDIVGNEKLSGPHSSSPPGWNKFIWAKVWLPFWVLQLETESDLPDHHHHRVSVACVEPFRRHHG